MEAAEQKTNINPLLSLMRQPKIYIKLPSQGRYWKEGSLDMSPNGEYAVYSMTARDELLLKTPDALLNGQAVVDVIQNCVPAIKNAWDCPNIDLDVILIAIRLASFGEKMEMTYDASGQDLTFTVDLRTLLDQLLESITWNERINVGTEMAIFVKPVTYQSVSKASIQNFEAQKIVRLVNDSTLSEEEKVATFRESFRKLTDLTVGIIEESVFRIESVAGTTEDHEHIKEFLSNCDKSIFDAVKNRLDELRSINELKPLKIKATPEMIANGSPEEVEVPLMFDASNFFV